tara:strand:+ start:816 stop:1490 length:675 start_codon:yes stop_codon:yes gene_type:complete
MIFIIRGHIRDAFKVQHLYNLIKETYTIYPDLKIFIHTWNIFENNISWKIRRVNNTIVNEEVIKEYFGDLKHLIHHIIIDDDSKIELIGNLNGNIANAVAPILGWKNYWYGKHKIIDYIYNQENINKNEIVVNCRFDISISSHSISNEIIINFLKKHLETIFTKNLFLDNNNNNLGIDNIYIGNVNTMYILIYKFYSDLDEILKLCKSRHQEQLVPIMNGILFD